MNGNTNSFASQTCDCVVASRTTALIVVPSGVRPVSTTSVCSRSFRPSHRIANALQAIGVISDAYSGGLNMVVSFRDGVASGSFYRPVGTSYTNCNYPTSVRARGGVTPPCFERVRPTL